MADTATKKGKKPDKALTLRGLMQRYTPPTKYVSLCLSAEAVVADAKAVAELAEARRRKDQGGHTSPSTCRRSAPRPKLYDDLGSLPTSATVRSTIMT